MFFIIFDKQTRCTVVYSSRYRSKIQLKTLLPNIILFIITLVFWNYTIYEIIDIIIMYLLDMFWVLRQSLNTYTTHYYLNNTSLWLLDLVIVGYVITCLFVHTAMVMFVNKNCSCLQTQILYGSVKLARPYSKQNEVNDKELKLS